MPINYFETSFEARDRRFQIEKLYHGETVDLVGTVTTDGVPKNITGYSVSGVFQPTSQQGSEDFYELSADIVENKVVVHWEKGKDFGEPSYMVWALLTDGNDASYPIAWRLDMAYSPSFPLSDLAPIPKAIDFSKYELLNAPWLELSAADDLPYLPLSGGTVTGEFAVENFIQSDETNITLGKNNELTQTANTVVVGNGNSVAGAGLARSSDIVVGTDNLARGLERRQVLVGASLSADTSEPVIGVGYYGTIGQDSVAVAEGPNFTKMQIGMNAVAIGFGISSVANNSIAIGHGANTDNGRTVQLGEGKPTASYQLNVFDKNVLSGYGFILNRDRIPYLDEYETKADAATEHQQLSNDLTAWVEGRMPEPEPPAKTLTLEVNSEVLTSYNPDEAAVTANFSIPTKISELADNVGLVTQDMMTAYAELSDVNESFNNARAYTDEQIEGLSNVYTKTADLTATYETIANAAATYQTKGDAVAVATLLTQQIDGVRDSLSDYAQLSDIPELPEDIVRKDDLSVYAQLSDLENISADVDITACLSSDEFLSVDFLSTDANKHVNLSAVSLTDIGDKINQILAALKRMEIPEPPPPPIDLTKTRIYYTDGTSSEVDIVGQINSSNVPNINSVSAIVIGTDVTSMASELFWNKTALKEIEIPGTVASIPSKTAKSDWINTSSANTNSNLTSIVLNEGLTAISNEAFFGAKESSITLPSTLKSIGMQAFTSNSELTSLSVPASVTSIALYPASMSYKLTSIVVDEANENYKSTNGLLLTKNGQTLICVPGGISGEVTIPDGVTTIAEGAAGSLSNCTSLELPSTLTSIGLASIDASRAQWGFSTLTIPSSVTGIGQYAFSKATGKTITMEGKTMAQVQAMSNYPWDVKSGSGTQFVCTDGTITR